MTGNFVGIPEDTEEIFQMERRFGGLVHIRVWTLHTRMSLSNHGY